MTARVRVTRGDPLACAVVDAYAARSGRYPWHVIDPGAFARPTLGDEIDRAASARRRADLLARGAAFATASADTGHGRIG